MSDDLVCYLCGETIGGPATVDHVPPKQFFAEFFRKQLNLSEMVTLKSHRDCNEKYSLDEEYFTAALSGVAVGSRTGRAVWQQKADRYRSGESRGLGFRILGQIESRPSGLEIPGGLSIMRLEAARVRRVLWKIVRGLYFLEHQEVLPEETPFDCELFEPQISERPRHPQYWEAVKGEPSKGPYQEVFAYKHLHHVSEDVQVHFWGLLIWDQIMVFLSHWDPADVESNG